MVYDYTATLNKKELTLLVGSLEYKLQRCEAKLQRVVSFLEASDTLAVVGLRDEIHEFSFPQLDSFLDYKTLAEAEEKRNANTD